MNARQIFNELKGHITMYLKNELYYPNGDEYLTFDDIAQELSDMYDGTMDVGDITIQDLLSKCPDMLFCSGELCKITIDGDQTRTMASILGSIVYSIMFATAGLNDIDIYDDIDISDDLVQHYIKLVEGLKYNRYIKWLRW